MFITNYLRAYVCSVILIFFVLMPLRAQRIDDADLINITTLEQLDAIRYDLNGNGVISFTTAASLPGSPMFGTRDDVLALMGADSIYAQAFTSGDFYATADAATAVTGAVAASTPYYYKLSNMATSPYTGYELRNNLDFNDTDATMMGDQPSIWSENCTDGACQTATAVDGDNADKVGWATIGYFKSSTDNASYTATFDGDDYMISNLYIHRSSTSSSVVYIGLFGFVGSGGHVRNLGIEGGSVTGEQYVGGLVGMNEGTIMSCYTTGNVTGNQDVGGLVGENREGTISSCYATGGATGNQYTGALTGRNNEGTIMSCYATGDVTGRSRVTSNGSLGGLVGENEGGTIRSCYATGDVSNGTDIGGLVGEGIDGGTISTCYATGNISGTDFVGGLIGENVRTTVSACYTTGDASGEAFIGGLVGRNDRGTISSCYARGDATGTRNGLGGLVGENTGDVSSPGMITDSYFDTRSSQTDAIGESGTHASASNVSGKTTAKLQMPTAYGTAMDIYANWNIDVDNGLDVGVDDGTAEGDATVDNPWDFGTDSEYPVLQLDFDVDGTATWEEFGTQSRALAPMSTRYRVTFDATWSSSTHSMNFPSNPHFSPLIGATHNNSLTLWAVGNTVGQDAAAGMKSMAETGATSDLTSDIDAAITAGTAAAELSGSGISPSPGESGFEFGIMQSHPEVTLVSMLAPSSDWFIGVHNLALFENGSWVGEKSIDLRVYDAGTEKDANVFSMTNSEEDPNVLISRLTHTETDFSDGLPKIGTMVFTRIDAPPPAVLTVSGFSPTSGAVGATVMITGSGFSTTATDNTVVFLGAEGGEADNEEATVSAAIATSLTVSVPTDAKTGKISVMVGTAVDTSDASFAVSVGPATLTVSGFTPTSGSVDTEVKIWGTSFSSTVTEDSISFGGSPYVVASSFIADTRSGVSPMIDTLVVSVPSNAQTGMIRVKILNGTPAMSTVDFVVEAPPAPDPPVVSGFTPTSGAVGTTVTITGTDFSTTAAENTVTFLGADGDDADNEEAEVSAAAATSLTVSVPTDAKTGKISVMVNSETDTSDGSFTVTGTIPEPAVFSVPLSSEGDVRVYPNPTLGQLHFKGLLAGSRYVCDLYSLVGQKVLSSVVRTGDTMDTSTLSSAQYILILQAEGRELMRTRLLVLE